MPHNSKHSIYIMQKEIDIEKFNYFNRFDLCLLYNIGLSDEVNFHVDVYFNEVIKINFYLIFISN